MLTFAQRVVMNKIYTLLLMALALSLLTLWKSYEKKEKEPFCVTYHVAVHALLPRKIVVTYTDDKGLEQETFVGKRWKKKVCLSPDEIASLRIDEITEPEKDYSTYFHDTEERHEPIDRDYIIHPLSIWIEHPKKTILSAGDKCLQVSLLASEIDKN